MKKILLVDDDMFIRDLVATSFQESEYKVFPAQTVNEGLEIFENERIDIILLDLDLPGENGIEVLRTIRADLASVDTPVVVFSNNADDEVRDEVMGAGANAFIVKVMMDMNELKREIDRILA